MEKLYSIYDENGIIRFCQSFEEGQQPENSTELLVTEQWAKPYFDEEANTIVNIATPEEQAAYLAQFEI